jgi:hypothetical protein
MSWTPRTESPRGFHGVLEQPFAVWHQVTIAPDLARAHLGVDVDLLALIANALPPAGCHDAFADLVRGVAPRLLAQFGSGRAASRCGCRCGGRRGGTRTPDPRIRNPMLYPAELHAPRHSTGANFRSVGNISWSDIRHAGGAEPSLPATFRNRFFVAVLLGMTSLVENETACRSTLDWARGGRTSEIVSIPALSWFQELR